MWTWMMLRLSLSRRRKHLTSDVQFFIVVIFLSSDLGVSKPPMREQKAFFDILATACLLEYYEVAMGLRTCKIIGENLQKRLNVLYIC